MIDIVTDRERNLKNLKQIGTPQDENKIYVENLAYTKIKQYNPGERAVHVLMGHTEKMNGKYVTFVEAAILVNGMEYAGGFPKWNNKVWGDVFREIKRLYDNMIIVGWVYDAKGLSPKMNRELERVHREYFGGTHQIFLLMDSIEKEETFYTYKENNLVPQEGFYIYYHAKEMPKEQVRQEQYSSIQMQSKQIHPMEEEVSIKGGRYREMMQSKQKGGVGDNSGIGIAVAVALLVFVIGVGAYENRESIFGKKKSSDIEVTGDYETESVELIEMAESTEETANSIPVEIIPGEEEKSSEGK